MSKEEKTTSKASGSAGNEEGEEVSKGVVENKAISETENEEGENGSESEASVEANGGEAGAVTVVVKRGRGRPRKNGSDGEQLVPESSPQADFLSSPFHNSLKRGRGRPRGSGRLQFLASLGGIAMATAGRSFTPHVLNIQIGEDIVSRMSLFSVRGPRAVCILSASGVVSVVIIRRPTGSIRRYEGPFEILTLSGSFLCSDEEGKRWERGGLSVSLAESDGRVFGGEVAGLMIAAAPVQLILGSFKHNIGREIKKWHKTRVLRKRGGMDLEEERGKTSDAERKDGSGEESSQAAAADSDPDPAAIELPGTAIGL